jgi:hypothetical protein
MCVPRFDGDPVFCDDTRAEGRFGVEQQDCVSIAQAYERDTTLVRRLAGCPRIMCAKRLSRSSDDTI